jgi:hypothetical protein
MVDDLLTKPVQRTLGPGIVGELLGFGLGVFVKPLLVDSMKHHITDYVEGRASTAGLDDGVRTVSSGGFSSIPGQLGFTGKIYKDIEYVRTEGKIALIGIKLFNAKYNEEMVLELKLRDAGGYWQLMELSNLQTFMGRILELQMGSSTQIESLLMPQPEPAGPALAVTLVNELSNGAIITALQSFRSGGSGSSPENLLASTLGECSRTALST